MKEVEVLLEYVTSCDSPGICRAPTGGNVLVLATLSTLLLAEVLAVTVVLQDG